MSAPITETENLKMEFFGERTHTSLSSIALAVSNTKLLLSPLAKSPIQAAINIVPMSAITIEYYRINHVMRCPVGDQKLNHHIDFFGQLFNGNWIF